jgi:hypothetical protein
VNGQPTAHWLFIPEPCCFYHARPLIARLARVNFKITGAGAHSQANKLLADELAANESVVNEQRFPFVCP